MPTSVGIDVLIMLVVDVHHIIQLPHYDGKHFGCCWVWMPPSSQDVLIGDLLKVDRGNGRHQIIIISSTTIFTAHELSTVFQLKLVSLLEVFQK